ncbi:MAG TPA: hypothetical protein VK403_11695 [Allosphingosinicella sp.]|nr:hypothetical protein [Allosphingosinicella sp.]
MDQTDSRHAHSPEPSSDDAASPFNCRPAEAPDRLDFEPVPLRYRTDGLTPEKQRAYVEALADCGVAREAAARIGVSEQSINRVRRRADARDFDRACEAAHMFGARRLRSIAFERAVEGTLKGHYYHGELVSQERVYDNRLLTYLLGKTEHLLEPPQECRAICENWEAHMDALEQGLPPPDGPDAAAAGKGRVSGPQFDGHEVWEDDYGVWWTEFPPPAGFSGEERGDPADSDYRRTLSAREQAAVDAQVEQEDADALAADHARRDRYFGFAGDEISSPGEAEPYEGSDTSEEAEEEDGGDAPTEYESMTPPRPSPRAPIFHDLPSHPGGSREGALDASTSKPPRPGILADEPPGAIA